MFAKFVTLALALPLVSAITFNTPTSATSGQTLTVSWSATTSDPATFTLELINPNFNYYYAVANNVVTSNGELSFTVPQVDDGSYSLEAVAVNNVNQVYTSSGTFSITAATASSTSASSTTSGSSTSLSASTASTTTASLSSSSLTTPQSSSTASTGTASSASSTPSSLSGGAAALKVPGMVPAAALVLSAVAGAAMAF